MKSNSEIADQLASLAQLLSNNKENPYKVRAYKRAASAIRDIPESLDDLVRSEEDLTQYEGIGQGIAHAIREIVLSGESSKLHELRASAPAEVLDINAFPRLDPKRVLQIYKKLGISSIEALRQKLDSGDLEKTMGARVARHVSQGLTEPRAILLYRADELCHSIQNFLQQNREVKRVEVSGEVRRRLETVEELAFVIETDHFSALIKSMESFAGQTPLLTKTRSQATFKLSAGIPLQLYAATEANWGTTLVGSTGSPEHLKKLKHRVTNAFPTEEAYYKNLSLSCIPPELREGTTELELASADQLPSLIEVSHIRGELHAHTTSSDGIHTIEQMAQAAKAKGYDFLGITDHSQSLKIANGVSTSDLRKQLQYIDRLNERSKGIRILKSSEVDILADGSLDYPDDLLRELDYTICSIHSRFALDKEAQTERIMRAMDNPFFNILGHATGRRLLKRPGYEVDFDRIVAHAQKNGCFFEINSNPERLELFPEYARIAKSAGIKLFVNTDAHSTAELDFTKYGIGQARRAGLEKQDVLNTLPWAKLKKHLKR